MLFHIRMTDYPVPRRNAALRERHWEYLDAHAEQIVARGPTQNDEGTVMRSSLCFVEMPDRTAVERFVAEEPSYQGGAYMSVEISGWVNSLNRCQRDFPRQDGDVYWYIRGYAKPGAHLKRNALLEAHKAYLNFFDPHFIVRGSIRNDEGDWLGSINLIRLQDRKAADLFAAEEPFCKAALFERVLIERFKPGGREGQIT